MGGELGVVGVDIARGHGVSGGSEADHEHARDGDGHDLLHVAPFDDLLDRHHAAVLPGSQTFTTGWNGTWSATPPSVQVAGPSFHKSIDPGTSFGVGFNASGSNDQPTDFTLNGVPCTT
ncbi:cellulose binding domain-containing protein [Nonomuraea angiospora]